MSRSLIPASSGRPPAARAKRGFTLVEMLVAMALTLLLMGSVVTIFDMLGRNVAHSRATIEMSNALRNATTRMRSDLEGITVPMLPVIKSGTNEGYFEYVEGPRSDMSPTLLSTVNLDRVDMTLLGDYDDVLRFTVRSKNEPFIGWAWVSRGGNPPTSPELVRSDYAEVIWFAVENPAGSTVGIPGLRTLYRRVLPIRPSLDISNSPTDATYYTQYDVSARVVSGAAVANSLGDLSLRQNRFASNSAFPHMLNTGAIHPLNTSSTSVLRPLTGTREGEDIILRNVLAFDVRVFDPGAPLVRVNNSTLSPGDAGFSAANITASTTASGSGAYVDLNYTIPATVTPASGSTQWFTGTPNNRSKITTPTWDTWPLSYEHDGVDTDGDGAKDEGTDGFDNNNSNGVDDPTELETAPPYNSPVRGIKVRFRVYDPDSGQVRELSVVQNFVPQ